MTSIKRHVVRTTRWVRGTRGNSLSQVVNLLASYVSSRRKKEVVSSYPFALHIEPALVCNYRCPACRHERRDLAPKNEKFMDFESYKGLLDQVKGRTWSLELTGHGESTLHPRFYEMVEYAVSNGFYTKMETNCSRIDIDKVEESGIQTIHMALDGMSQETYARYRVRGNFHEVKRNLENLVELRNRTGWPHLELRFLVFGHNQHELDEAKDYLDSLDISWRFQWARIPNGFACPESIYQLWNLEVTPEAFEEWSPTLPEFIAYKKDESTGFYRHDITRGELEPICTAPWTMVVVRSSGEAVPCCEILNDPGLSYGNVFERPFEEIWNGPQIRELRRTLAKDPAKLHPCNICPTNLV